MSHVDANATASFIRNELLSLLDLCTPQAGFDIGKLDDHVRTLMKSLHARRDHLGPPVFLVESSRDGS
jgi:hypothetical protein